MRVSWGSIKGTAAAQRASAFARSTLLTRPDPVISIIKNYNITLYLINLQFTLSLKFLSTNRNLLGQVGRRTKGFIMGNFFSGVVFSFPWSEESDFNKEQGDAADTKVKQTI